MSEPATSAGQKARAPGAAEGKPKGTRKARSARPSTPAPASPVGRSVALLPEHFISSECRAAIEYFNPSAREVFIAGSFNNWQPRATALRREPSGKWSAELFLKPGCYEYRFIVDGQWLGDPMAARFVANPFGGLNCVLEVVPARSSV